MAGTKKYDRIELLDTAIELFREHGYAGTSTADLVDGLGVNRKSMYAEFGSKQGLFEAALERYDEHQLSGVLGPLEAPDAGADTIRGAFVGYAEANEGWFHGKGCLMCNSAVERAALDPASRRFSQAYLTRIQAAFTNALSNARTRGEIAADADVEQLAAFFTTSMIGVAASIRATASTEQLRASTTVITSVLDR